MFGSDNIKVIAIAALGKDTRFICNRDELLWRISDDLKKVREETMGHPIIMGRKTYESIGRPLPGRHNIILTRDRNSSKIEEHENISLATNIKEALELAKKWCSDKSRNKIFIFGGAEIYKLALDYTDELMLTLVQSDRQGTARFPEYENQFNLVDESEEYFDKKEQVKYTRAIFARKNAQTKNIDEAMVTSSTSG